MENQPPMVEISSSAVPPAAGPRYGERSRREHADRGGYSPFLPLLILVVASVAWPAFQCYQLLNERQALTTVFGNQAKQVEDSSKLRNALDGLARDTALLAAKGNASAKLIVDELARRGVTINPNAPATPAAAPAAGNSPFAPTPPAAPAKAP